MSRRWLTPLLALLLPAVLLWSLTLGSVSAGLAELWQAVGGAASTPATTIVLELRLPRALAALAVGGLLALAGVLLQALLRNPLADPFVLGVSGGAASGALLAMLLGAATLWVNTAAFAGAFLCIVLVLGLARGRGSWTRERLLLTGAVVASGFGALISLLLALAPHTQLPGMVFWLLGDLSNAPFPTVALLALVIGLVVAFVFGRALNVLARGDAVAATLGENPLALRLGTYALAALLSAIAVTTAGSVGFVGLVVPHLARLLGGGDHRRLVLNAALLGALLLLIADTLARTLLAPQQLPVGVVTALIGVPTFLFLLARGDHA
jgi:iron complex transport system permease protein